MNRGLFVVLAALLLSGVASILNQVLWQRALKIFLGGSESICAMIVVLVFMLGLGIGSAIAGANTRRIRDPLLAFGLVEIALFVVNSGVAFSLTLDLGETVYAAQRFAVAAQIPRRVVYAIGALVLLLPPTILMGATLPLAAEACQRQLDAIESKLLTILLALNTIGACLGAIGGSFFLLPWLGQRISLGVAASFNLAAGLAALALARAVRSRSVDRPAGGPVEDRSGLRAFLRRRLSLEEQLGFSLGFLSLGYEMFLLRLVSLAHEPRPYTFAFTLLFFLLFWTFGVWLSGRRPIEPMRVVGLGSLLVAAMPALQAYDRWSAHFTLYRGGLAYFLPCVCFGLLYGMLVSRAASEWGRDVGRFYALNTSGSCLGILFFSLVGYEMSQGVNAAMISLGLVAVLLQFVIAGRRDRNAGRPARGLRAVQVGIAALAILLVVRGLDTRRTDDARGTTYWGRDGVVEVRPDGSVWIDGLWHSALSNGKSHVGSPYNWMMVVAAVLAHRDEPLRDALVVGNGIGITAVTLTKIDGLEVDAYEINRTLARLLADRPKRTLYSATHPRIRIRWQDGRSGLALDEKRYDLVISAPLHLRAAGSSNLLSREYFELVRSRLKPNGVVALYSQEGKPEQAEIIRATVRSVFAHSETFLDGVLTVASDTPIEITPEAFRRRIERDDPLFKEMAALDRFMRRRGQGRLIDRFDEERLPTRPTPYIVTDDRPIVEYPTIAARLIARTPAVRKGAEPFIGQDGSPGVAP